MSMNIHTHLSHLRTIPQKKYLSIQDTSHVILKDSQSKSVTTLEVWHWGPRWFGKNRTPNPENLQQKVGYLFSKGNPSRSFPKIGFFFEKEFFKMSWRPSSEGGDQLGAGPIHGLNYPSYSKKTSFIYTYVSQMCVFPGVFSSFHFPMMDDVLLTTAEKNHRKAFTFGDA